jgi:hypothetical protein
MARRAALFLIAIACFSVVHAASPVSVLFVGNSYTFGRVDPVLGYNAAAVHDLTAAFNELNPAGTNSFPIGTPGLGWFEPHPWGGVPGIFKKMTKEAGLDYDVSLSTRNAASLRGQFLDTANSAWKLRENVATARWDVVVLQEQSDAALPPGFGKNANLATFNAYADQFERFIHVGAAQTYTEAQLFGSLAACTATGLSATSCNINRVIAQNTNASPATRVYLEQTWARPDMVFPHLITTPDLATADGRPIVDTSAAGGPATLYYSNLAGMTADLHAAFFNKALTNPNFAGVAAVGDAFQRAVNERVAKGSGFYKSDGTYDESSPNPINLWWLDRTHASKYGSYLSALVLFATVTNLNPLSLGPDEEAAAELEIPTDVAGQLQRIAQLTVAPDNTPPATTVAASPPPNASGWNNANVTISLKASDNANGSGIQQITYATTGAQVGSGIVAGDSASFPVIAEGETTITYFSSDRAGNAEAPKSFVVRIDKTSPTIAGLPAALCSVWPPNHRFVQVAVVVAKDGLSGLSSFNTNVDSNEPSLSGEVDSITVGTGLEPRTISVRAERLAEGAGRIYVISAVATDAAGNTAAASSDCVVPHDQDQ